MATKRKVDPEALLLASLHTMGIDQLTLLIAVAKEVLRTRQSQPTGRVLVRPAKKLKAEDAEAVG